MFVIPWLDQGIQKAWMPGSSPEHDGNWIKGLV
jgi:hypothetical protein